VRCRRASPAKGLRALVSGTLTAFKVKRIAGAMDWGYPPVGSIRSIADRQTPSATSIESPKVWRI
jgi:hypothetical protein